MSSYPLLSFLISLLLAAAVCTHGQEPVKDTDGNVVRIGELYYIQLVNAIKNGGLIPATINLDYCAVDIIQVQDQPGVPVWFGYWPGYSPPSHVVTTGRDDITIQFNSTSDACKDIITNYWEVREFPWPPNPQTAITIGGQPKELKSHFKIEKVGEETQGYKLKTFNGVVGARPGIRNGALQLVVAKDTNEITHFKFIKVKDATTAVTSTSHVDKLGLRMFPFY